MASATLTATSNSGSWNSDGGTDANAARDGTGTLALQSDANARVGMRLSATIYQAYILFLEFDLSNISGPISAATLSVSCNTGGNDAATGFTITAAMFDYGTLTSADWRTDTQLAALTAVASKASTGIIEGGWFALTDIGLPAALTAGTKNRLIVYSSRHASAATPVGNEYFTGTLFTVNPAKLDLTSPGGIPQSAKARAALHGVGRASVW